MSDKPEPEVANGVPHCTERCPQHDGKRCRLLGLRPSTVCEPAVLDMTAALTAADALADALTAAVNADECAPWPAVHEALRAYRAARGRG